MCPEEGKDNAEPTEPITDVRPGEVPPWIDPEAAAKVAGPKKHKHSYRKDGTCACGHVRKPRKKN